MDPTGIVRILNRVREPQGCHERVPRGELHGLDEVASPSVHALLIDGRGVRPRRHRLLVGAAFMPARRVAEVPQLARADIRMELHRHPYGFIPALLDDLAIVAERLVDLGLGESQGVCRLPGGYTPWVGPRSPDADPAGRIERTAHCDHRVPDLGLRDASVPDESLVQRVEGRPVSP